MTKRLFLRFFLLIFWSTVYQLASSAYANQRRSCSVIFGVSDVSNFVKYSGVEMRILRVLERNMKEILRRDYHLKDVENETKYYNYMNSYSSLLPIYNTPKSLIDSGILKFKNGVLVSNYIISYTHLGVLGLTSQNDGTFVINHNRGTPYFRGVNSPVFGGYPALDYIRSAEGKSIYPSIQVAIAVPRSEVERIGIDPTGSELWIEQKILRQLRGIRVFKTNVQIVDLQDFESNQANH